MNHLLFLKAIVMFLICFSCSQTLKAQVCSGSLGDPVINVTFGSGQNPGPPLQAATTSYTFTSSICPDDGSYTVVNSTAGCFGNSWHTITEDHTPNDVNGYMMLVNASFNPGDFYIDTVKNLCANTTYEFAAWVMNVLLPSACSPTPIMPKLIFNIETTTGTVLGTYSTGDVPSSNSPVWTQYGLFFKTPVNANTVVIRLTNTAPGGCGNDLALDDITFRPCGPGVTATVVNNSQQAIDLCKNVPVSVSVTANTGTGYVRPAFQWQQSPDNGTTWIDITGATSVNYLFTQTVPGVYKYRMAVAEAANISISNCRVASNIVTITIHDFPVVTATSNSPVCEKGPINLTATGGTTFAWNGPGGFTSDEGSPSLPAQLNATGNYGVTVTDEFGCKNNASVTVMVKPKPVATISNPQTFCEGNTVTLLATGGTSYLWSPPVGLSDINIANPVASPVDTTVYSVVATGANDCTDTLSVSLNVIKKPTADAGPDKILLRGQQVVLEGSAGGSDISYAWSPATFLNDPLLMQPVSTALNDIHYTLAVTSNQGCGSASDEVFVKVYNDIYIPTAFSPNDDGLNDTWRIDGLAAVPKAVIRVYNRFGNLVFETTGNSNQWDGTYKGKRLASGAYAYMVDLKNGMPLRKGMVILIR